MAYNAVDTVCYSGLFYKIFSTESLRLDTAATPDKHRVSRGSNGTRHWSQNLQPRARRPLLIPSELNTARLKNVVTV
jgi:hypothetical protein